MIPSKILSISYIDLKQVDDFFVPDKINISEENINVLNELITDKIITRFHPTELVSSIADEIDLKKLLPEYTINVASIKYEESKKSNEYFTHLTVQYLSPNYDNTLEGYEFYIELLTEGRLILLDSETFRYSSALINNVMEHKLFKCDIPTLFKQLDVEEDIEISLFSLSFDWGIELTFFSEEMLELLSKFDVDELNKIVNQFIYEAGSQIEYLSDTKREYRCTIILKTLKDVLASEIDECSIINMISDNDRDDFVDKNFIPTYYVSDYNKDQKIFIIYTPAYYNKYGY